MAKCFQLNCASVIMHDLKNSFLASAERCLDGWPRDGEKSSSP